MTPSKVLVAAIRKLRRDMIDATRDTPLYRLPTPEEAKSPQVHLLRVLQGGHLENESWLRIAPGVLNNVATLLSRPDTAVAGKTVPIISPDQPLPETLQQVSAHDLCLLSVLQLKNAFNAEARTKIRTHQAGWTRKTQTELTVKEQKHITSLYRRYERRLTTVLNRMM